MVRRRQGEKLIDTCIRPTYGNHGPSVMVWGGNHHARRSELVVLDGTPDCQSYIRLLRDSVLPWECVFGRNFVHAQDNATPHTARGTTAFLVQQDLEVMDWPAWSPDIEHVWDQMGVWIRYTYYHRSLPLCQNCSVLSSRRGLQFAQEGWGPWWRACHVLCALFSPPEGSHKLLVVWCIAVSMFNRFIKSTVICHLVFFHDAITWIRSFTTVELPQHFCFCYIT